MCLVPYVPSSSTMLIALFLGSLTTTSVCEWMPVRNIGGVLHVDVQIGQTSKLLGFNSLVGFSWITGGYTNDIAWENACIENIDCMVDISLSTRTIFRTRVVVVHGDGNSGGELSMVALLDTFGSVTIRGTEIGVGEQVDTPPTCTVKHQPAHSYTVDQIRVTVGSFQSIYKDQQISFSMDSAILLIPANVFAEWTKKFILPIIEIQWTDCGNIKIEHHMLFDIQQGKILIGRSNTKHWVIPIAMIATAYQVGLTHNHMSICDYKQTSEPEKPAKSAWYAKLVQNLR